MPALNKLQLLVSQSPIEFAIVYGFGDVLGSDVFGVGQVGSTATLAIGGVISEMAAEHFAMPG